jgi:hypothetical protein
MRWGWRIEVLVGKAEGECAHGRKYLVTDVAVITDGRIRLDWT